MSIRIQEQLLYEIAMSVGKSMDLETMLSTAISTYLRRLCCMSARIILQDKDSLSFDKAFSIPMKEKQRSAFDDFSAKISSCETEDQLSNLRESLPLHTSFEGDHYYLMNLPEAGFLMIGKGLYPLPHSMLKSLQKINIRLAESIISCQTHRNNEILNEKLQNQIREREKAEQAILEERQKYRVIFDNSPLGVIYFDHEGVIRDCNPKFMELMGSTKKELIGFSTAKKGTPEMREVMDKALNGESAIYEGNYISVTGNKKMYIRAVFNPVSPGKTTTEVIATVEQLGEFREE
ncbi:PAS domain-containing protein [Maridesulfovibrio salexigens]|uniref:Putative PAS/PAC sensor protein n=1 Tax=Maridesulfovibrio salexigens (strain ATCC 14822 / DSM 2638 / NCIMB 8403 / VKM B-1763) TaxID=526222 RepID=C6BU95_MARSD|nr:PAS domain S-box protein [Maridesulfovibrio salexigens]ACS81804.1 putative PAS/PAC sensor protein [Maridesulfovibrio salexigens DSM 2638]